MSFDVIVLKLRRTLRSLGDAIDDDAMPLGTLDEIRDNCRKVFPAVRWSTERLGLEILDDQSAFELTIPDVPEPRSLHLCYRFGPAPSDASIARFERLMKRLWTDFGWQAFAVSDNSALSSDMAPPPR